MGVLDRLMFGSGIPSSDWCDVLVPIGPIYVHGLFVIPLCFAALAIGIWGFRRVRASGLPGTLSGTHSAATANPIPQITTAIASTLVSTAS